MMNENSEHTRNAQKAQRNSDKHFSRCPRFLHTDDNVSGAVHNGVSVNRVVQFSDLSMKPTTAKTPI